MGRQWLTFLTDLKVTGVQLRYKILANKSVFKHHAEKLVCNVGWVLALAKIGQDLKVTRSFGFP
jgi:hypothetical protein